MKKRLDELRQIRGFIAPKLSAILGKKGAVAVSAAIIAVFALAIVGLVQNFAQIVAIVTTIALTYAAGKGVIVAWRANQRKRYNERAKNTIPDFLISVLVTYESGATFPIPIQKIFSPVEVLNHLEVDSATPVVRIRLPVTRRWTEDEAGFQAAIAKDELCICAAQYARDKGLEALRKGKHPYIYIDSVRVVGINLQLEFLLTDYKPAIDYLRTKENPPEQAPVNLTDHDFV